MVVREPYPVHVKQFVPIKIKEPIIVKVPVYKEYHHETEKKYEHKPMYETYKPTYNMQPEQVQSGYESPAEHGSQDGSYSQEIGGTNEYKTPEKETSYSQEDDGQYNNYQQQQENYGGALQHVYLGQQQGNEQQQYEQQYESDGGQAYAASARVSNIETQQQKAKQSPEASQSYNSNLRQVSIATQYKTGQLNTNPANYVQKDVQVHIADNYNSNAAHNQNSNEYKAKKK